MGCGSSQPEGELVFGGCSPKPESDVDVASVRDFAQEQKEAEVAAALRASPSPQLSVSSRHSSYHSETESVIRRITAKLSTPSSVTSSVTALAFYLTSVCPCSDLHDLHCVRAIFLWLALNITEESRNHLYQLCHRTIDISTFSSMVRRDQLACDVGLRLLTHKHGVIGDVIHDVTIRVQSTKRRLRLVTAYLVEKKKGKGLRKDRSSVLTSQDNYYT
ncbi:hypothetical protein ACOMHN_011541 [Nucella lapillus]